jgi:hypothetical protein
MWNLQNLARNKIQPRPESESKLRYMLRASLSSNDETVLADTLVAFSGWALMSDDEQRRELFDITTVNRLVVLLRKYSSPTASQVNLYFILRILGSLNSTCNISESLQVIIENGALDTTSS